MATEVFDLEGKVSVDYSDAQKGLNKISEAAEDVADNLDDVDDSADKVSDSIEDSGDSADKADDSFSTWKLTLANLASQVITQLISKCAELTEQVIETGMETEYAFAQLETIAGTENIDSLTESIMTLSSETGIAADELAVTAYNAISAGSSAEDAADMVEAACKLATAGFTDTDSALSILSTAMNAYGDEAGTVTEISDGLIQVQNLGVTTVAELASAMGKSIATGSAYGVSLGNLESAYVSLTKAGISTEESTTYLNSMMAELGDSGSDVAAILEAETGKSFSELMSDGYSLSDVLGIVYESLGEDSTAMMNLWSSQEAGKASNAIINQGLDTFNENLETITSSSGSTEAAYQTMADTMSTKTDIMKTSFENLGLELYDQMEPAIESIVDWITNNFIPGLESLIENMDIILPIVAGLAAGFITLKASLAISSLISTVTTAWKAYQTASKGATIAQYLLNAAMNANSIVLIVTLIASLVAAIVVLWNTNEDFRNKVLEIWEAIKSAFGTAIEAIQTFFSGLVDSISTALSTAWNTITSVFDSIVQTFQTIWETIKGIFDSVVEAFQGVWQSITNIFNSIVEAISTAWETIKNVVQVAIMFIVEVITAAFELITIPFAFIWENCKETILAAWEAIKTAVSTALDAISTIISNVWNAIVAFLSPILEGIKNTFSTVWNAISTTISTVVNAISTTISNVWNSIKTTLTNVLNSIKTTFSNVWNSIKTTVSNVINSIKTTISNVFNSVKSTISTILNSIKSTFSTVWNAVKSSVSTIINGIKSTISTGMNAASSTVTNVLNSIKNSFSNILNNAATTVSNVISRIKGMFNFSWSLPNLKLPHVSISGSFSLSPPSVPSFSISWYKQAMDDGMIMNSPTIFGFDSESQSFLAGGEAGSETVVGTDSLTNKIQAAVAAENSGVKEAVLTLVSLVDEKLTMILENQGYDIVTEDGTILAYYTPLIDKELGILAKKKGR